MQHYKLPIPNLSIEISSQPLQYKVIQNKKCTQRRHRNIFSELSQISVVHQSEVISFMIMHHRKSLKRASIVGILKQRKKIHL